RKFQSAQIPGIPTLRKITWRASRKNTAEEAIREAPQSRWTRTTSSARSKSLRKSRKHCAIERKAMLRTHRGQPETLSSRGKIKNSWTGSSMVEQLTLNQRVVGSSPTRFTTLLRNCFSFHQFTILSGVAADPELSPTES